MLRRWVFTVFGESQDSCAISPSRAQRRAALKMIYSGGELAVCRAVADDRFELAEPKPRRAARYTVIRPFPKKTLQTRQNAPP